MPSNLIKLNSIIQKSFYPFIIKKISGINQRQRFLMVFTKNKSLSFQQKKDILTHFIHAIILSYNDIKKVHELHLFLKRPLIFKGINHPFTKNVQKKNLLKP